MNMREAISLCSGSSGRRLDTPRRCTTQPPGSVSNTLEHFKPGYLELPPEVMERLVSTKDSIEDHYDVDQQPFARGKYATVRRCRHKITGQIFAAKYLRKRRRSVDLTYEILHEVAVLHACTESTRIVNLYQVFETAHEMILILEMASGGELQTIVDRDEALDEEMAKKIMIQILDGVIFLHSINIAHLDIKPQNLVLCGTYPDCDVKLCDFGISRYIGQGSDIREMFGTPDYVAPEVLNYESISLSTDMWSVGVLVYVLLTGCSPFLGETNQDTYCNITRCHVDFPDELFEGISLEAQDLMKKLMVKEPSKRLSASDCLKHDWFQLKSVPSTIITEKVTPELARKITEMSVRTPESIRRTPSIKRTPEINRKTIDCVRRTESIRKLDKIEKRKLTDSKLSLVRVDIEENKTNCDKTENRVKKEEETIVKIKECESRPQPKTDAILDKQNTIEVRKTNLKTNLALLAKRFSSGDLSDNEVEFLITDEKKNNDRNFKKAVSNQTMPSLYMRNKQDDKSGVLVYRRICHDDLSQFTHGQAAILIQVPASGQSSMSSISGGSSETSSITSDTVSEMSVDSTGDCSSVMSSDDSLDYIFRNINKNVWETPKRNKVWVRECKGSYARAVQKFNDNDKPKVMSKMYQKNTNFNFNSLNRKSIYTSTPILNKIGHFSNNINNNCKRSGLELMTEDNGNVIVIREVRAGRYSKFNEVKCESLQSRIKKLQCGVRY